MNVVLPNVSGYTLETPSLLISVMAMASSTRLSSSVKISVMLMSGRVWRA